MLIDLKREKFEQKKQKIFIDFHIQFMNRN